MTLKPPPPRLSETILTILGKIDNWVPHPRTWNQLLYWDREEYFRAKERKQQRIRKERKQIQKAVWALEKAEYVTHTSRKKESYKLTPKGWLRAAWISSKYYQPKKIKRGNLMLIIFDVPEKYGPARDLFRNCLVNLGFDHIQKSVFLTRDKKAFEFVQRIIAESDIKPFVRLGVLKTWH